MLLSSLVATQASPPEDRQFLSRSYTKNQRTILISLFAAFAEISERRDNVCSLPHVHVLISDLRCQRLRAKKSAALIPDYV